MIPFTIFSKMNNAIKWRVEQHDNNLYLYLVFPIAIAFLITFGGSRMISHFWPDIYIPWAGIHVHHFAYGFFVLAVSGYLALIFSEPLDKYLISLLHGFGLGLAFDEFGIWLRLRDDDPARFSYDGFLIIIGTILLIITARPGILFMKRHLPFLKKRPTLPN